MSAAIGCRVDGAASGAVLGHGAESRTRSTRTSTAPCARRTSSGSPARSVRRVAHDVTRRVAHDGVAAVERRERAERAQRGGSAATQVRPGARQASLEHHRQAVVEPLEPAPRPTSRRAVMARVRAVEQQAGPLALGRRGTAAGPERLERASLGVQRRRAAVASDLARRRRSSRRAEVRSCASLLRA